MAIEKIINIVAKTDKAVYSVNELKKMLNETDEANEQLNKTAEETSDVYKKTSKESVQAVEKIGDSAKKQEGVMKKLGSAVSKVGTALKALGIGLVIALVAKFTQVLSENQKVVDFVSGVSNTLGIIINQLVESFIQIGAKINEATGGFDALGKVVGSAVKIAFNNLKIVILELQAGFTALKLAYEKVFGDDKGVEKAKKDLEEIGKKIKSTVKDNVEQGKNIIKNVGEAVDEVVTGVTTLVKDGTKAISEIDVKSAYAQGQAIARSRKNFELLALQQERIIQQYEFQAETLRQVRDDDTKSIADRIKANQELGGILDKQAQAEKAQVNARISALSQEQKLLGFTQERQNEIFALQTELLAIDNKIASQKSEQLTNESALYKEQIDLLNTIYDGKKERDLAELEFQKEISKTEEDRFKIEQEIIKKQQEQNEESLKRAKEQYKEGTQARIDAEQEYLNKKQEIDFAERKLIDEQNQYKKDKAKEIADKEIEYREAVKEATYSIAGQTLSLLGEIAGEGNELSKAIAVAQATVSGIEGVQNAYTTAQKSPITIGFPGYPILQAGLAGAFSALQIKKILSTKIGGGSNVSGNVGGGGAPQAPSFNLVSGTGTNQIAESLATERQPVKAYVVASEMTTQQALENNISSTASLG